MDTKPRFTTVQSKILQVLADGQRHTPQELHACLFDELSQMCAVSQQVSRLRKILLGHGETIVCELTGYKRFYRHVKLLNHSNPPSGQ